MNPGGVTAVSGVPRGGVTHAPGRCWCHHGITVFPSGLASPWEPRQLPRPRGELWRWGGPTPCSHLPCLPLRLRSGFGVKGAPQELLMPPALADRRLAAACTDWQGGRGVRPSFHRTLLPREPGGPAWTPQRGNSRPSRGRVPLAAWPWAGGGAQRSCTRLRCSASWPLAPPGFQSPGWAMRPPGAREAGLPAAPPASCARGHPPPHSPG